MAQIHSIVWKQDKEPLETEYPTKVLLQYENNMKKIDITKPLRTRTYHNPVVILSDKGPGPFNIVGYIVDSSQHGTLYQWSNDGKNRHAGLPFIENEPEPPKMVPLEAKDFKFGDLLRHKELSQGWLAVLGIQDNLALTKVSHYSFNYLQKHYNISRDGGKTWEKCEKLEN